MTTSVFLAVIAAAFLHAGWNALIRGAGGNRVATMLVMSLTQGVIGLALVGWQPWPEAHLWPWFLASGLVHTAYKLFLTYAYERGDLSRVYPIARGGAPLLVLIFGAIWLSDVVRPLEYMGCHRDRPRAGVDGAGAFSRRGESRRMLPFAIGSALATAAYSILDGMGARLAGDAQFFVGWMFLLDGIFFGTFTGLMLGLKPYRAQARVWVRGAMAASVSYGAYAIVVWAMTVAPIALVTALRETSILFAVLIGWLVFGERIGSRQGRGRGGDCAGHRADSAGMRAGMQSPVGPLTLVAEGDAIVRAGLGPMDRLLRAVVLAEAGDRIAGLFRWPAGRVHRAHGAAWVAFSAGILRGAPVRYHLGRR